MQLGPLSECLGAISEEETSVSAEPFVFGEYLLFRRCNQNMMTRAMMRTKPRRITAGRRVSLRPSTKMKVNIKKKLSNT